jgi:hypothetical protein
MIIKLYKAGYGFQLVFFTLAVVMLWLDAFITPKPPMIFEYQTPLYIVVVTLFSHLPPIVNVITALLLLLLQSYILNFTLVGNKIIPGNTFLPVLLYSVLMSYDPSLLRLHPVLIANLFLIMALRIILKIYNEKEPYIQIFNAGLFISIASLFYLPSLIFLVFIWIAFFIYRVSTTREWIIVMAGIIAPYLYLLVYYFWFDKLDIFYSKYIGFFARFEPLHLKSNPFDYAFGILISLVTLLSFINVLGNRSGKVISLRKKILVIIYFFIVSLGTYVYAGRHIIYHSTQSFIAIAMLMTCYFTTMRRIVWAEIFFSALIIIIVLQKIIF